MSVQRFFGVVVVVVLSFFIFVQCGPNLGEGGTPLYQVYRYVSPQRVWFLSRFGLKTAIDFEHFGLKLGMIIGETFTKAYFPSQQPG